MMLDKKMEWTVKRFDASYNLQSFFSNQSLAIALQQADEWRMIWGKGTIIKIRRQLVAHFSEV